MSNIATVCTIWMASEVNKLATKNWKWRAAHAELARLVKMAGGWV